MKILLGKQIRGADRATIEHEPVESIDLMERAAEVIAQWVCNNVEQDVPLLFFVGKGNNGGDGLAVARMLSRVDYECTVVMPYAVHELSEECQINLERLPEEVMIVDAGAEIDISPDTVVVDALMGTGMSGELSEPLASLVELINSLPNRVISIDLPSGMKSEFDNDPAKIVHAQTTLALEFVKLAMLLPESGECCGRIEVLDIELDVDYINDALSDYFYVTEQMVRGMVLPRAKFSHKGSYGHALLICGSEAMMGAATIATCGALRSGCGLVTLHTPSAERFAVQTLAPSAMLSLDAGRFFTTTPSDLDKYTVLGIGCGLGQEDQTKLAMIQTLKKWGDKPVVYDADAINMLAEHPELLSLVAPGSVFTPHIGELRRLVGEWESEEHKLEMVCTFAQNLQCVVVVKGAHTMLAMPDGAIYFNSTGCAAMAKGGVGDLLTGLITGLIARGYEPAVAALVGVYAHGRAGEKCADYFGVESMNSSDMIDFVGEAIAELY